MKSSRIVFLDYIRIAACFMVLLVHSCEMFYCTAGPNGEPWFTRVASEDERLWVALYDGFCRMAVPLFMIVSAYLLVPMRQGQGMVDFYRRRAKRILPSFVIFLLAYCLIPYLQGYTDSETAIHDLAHAPFNFPVTAGHLWFMYPLLGLYLFIPIVSPWLEKATAKEEQIFIGLFAVSTCLPFLNRVVGPVWGECDWNQFGLLWNFSGYLGYLVLAHYIRVHLDWSRTKRQVVGWTCMIAGAMPTILSFYLMVPPETYVYTGDAEIAWAFCTPNVLLLTFGAFLLFTTIRRTEPSQFVLGLSDLTFGIYLMHLLILPPWAGVLKETGLPVVLTILAIAVCTFLSCWLLCLVFRSLPFGHHIIGCTPNPAPLFAFGNSAAK